LVDKQLNKLVISYQKSGCEEMFRDIYTEVTERWKRGNVINSISKRYGLDSAEVESIANYELYNVVLRYEPVGNFYNFLSTVISGKCIDERRRLQKEIESEITLDYPKTSEEDEESAIIDYFIGGDVEEEAIEKLQKKGDQRQLIAQLYG